MSTKTKESSTVLTIGPIEIDVVKKDIKRMHLAVYPPHGRVRLAVPEDADEEVYRLFAISKLSWIKKNVKHFKEQARETIRDYVTGESHFFNGKRYLLEVIEGTPSGVVIKGVNKLILTHPNKASREKKANIMKEWYRAQLKIQIEQLLPHWEEVVGVQVNAFGVKQMKTKWGTCNPEAKRIWLNLELGKKPKICLEYIIVHELVHLHEKHHNKRFIQLMDEFMPKWRLYRDELNSLPVVHNDWGY